MVNNHLSAMAKPKSESVVIDHKSMATMLCGYLIGLTSDAACA